MTTQIIRNKDGYIKTGNFCLLGAGKSKSSQCKMWTRNELIDLIYEDYEVRTIFVGYELYSRTPEEVRDTLSQLKSIKFLAIDYDGVNQLDLDPNGLASESLLDFAHNLDDYQINELLYEDYIRYDVSLQMNGDTTYAYIEIRLDMYSDTPILACQFGFRTSDYTAINVACATLKNPSKILVAGDYGNTVFGLDEIKASDLPWTKIPFSAQGNTISYVQLPPE